MNKNKTTKKFNVTKLISIILLVVLSISTLTACSSKATEQPVAAPSTQVAPANNSVQNTGNGNQNRNGNPAQSSTQVTTQENTNHSIDLANVKPLSESDKKLSLKGYGNAGALADESMSIADMLTYAIQDEYTARGEYIAIMDKFNVQNPYSNIMKSEETHIASLKSLYEAYGLTVPADDSKEHVVVPKDLLEAAKTGVQAEINNIAMYEKFLTYDLPDSVKQVFLSLGKASENHLRAFENQVSKLQ